MLNGEQTSYYELLELSPDATSQEVRDAYLRAKNAYRKDSVALYSLFSDGETEDLLKKIEEAYQVLSHPDRRKDYDRRHGLIFVNESVPTPSPFASTAAQIVSIDRVPPMDPGASTDELLIPPVTDFGSSPKKTAAAATPSVPPAAEYDPFVIKAGTAPTPEMTAPSNSAPSTSSKPLGSADDRPLNSFDAALAQELETETEWKGPLLRRVRETKRIAIEEISEFTKISRTYLNAIEEENFSKLPAPVYLRGFLVQLAKYLKLPADKITNGYLVRFNVYWKEKNK